MNSEDKQGKPKKEAAAKDKEVSADTAKIEKVVLGYMDKNKGVTRNPKPLFKDA